MGVQIPLASAFCVKYTELFRGGAGKASYLPISDDVYEYTIYDVESGLDKLNLNKATSWDFIPGKVFSEIKNDKEAIKGLCDLLNDLSKCPVLPHQIATGRLLCLNKNRPEPGSLDSIRPITITGVISKLLEFPLLRELKKVKLSKSQLGFRERMSTEMNIMKLIHKMSYLKKKGYTGNKKMEERYILFVDLRQAFDSVNHERLIVKLLNKEVSLDVINSLIKQINSAYMSVDLINYINVNRGVGQGKLCSPILFDIYIDDLLETLSKIAHTVLAFADDTGFICEDLVRLNAAITALEMWCELNDIELNKLKSGIMIINDNKGLAKDNIKGIPVVNKYKYLGVLLLDDLTVREHITAIRDKVDDYFVRYNWLNRKYFTPKSLLEIINYFIKSRFLYGMSLFMDTRRNLERLDSAIMKHIKSIFKLPFNSSHDRLRILLAEPEIEYKLAIRLLKIYHRYKYHFGESPDKYRKQLLLYFDEEVVDEKVDVDYKHLGYELEYENLNSLFLEKYPDMGFKLRHNHKDFIKTHIYNSLNLRDYYFLKYLGQLCMATNKRWLPICICGMENSEGHAVNECEATMSPERRRMHKNKLDRLYDKADLKRRANLHEYIIHAYFVLEHRDRGLIKRIIGAVRSLVFESVTRSNTV